MRKNLTPIQLKEMRERINNKGYVDVALGKIADDLSEAFININAGEVMFEKKKKIGRISYLLKRLKRLKKGEEHER